MPATNLSGLKKFAEMQMSDEVLITRDPQGSTDDVLDPTTGEYIRPVGDDLEIYRGKAMILPINVFPSESQEGGGLASRTDYEMHIPLESAKLADLDRVVVLASERNPHMVGEDFLIREAETGSVVVSQKARIMKRTVTVIL